jgi:hypothetical protein
VRTASMMYAPAIVPAIAASRGTILEHVLV